MSNPYELALGSSWSLYKTVRRDTRYHNNYANNYELVNYFAKVNNIGKFWEMINYLGSKSDTKPNSIKMYDDELFFMRDNIQPLWEDKKNFAGGSYSIKVKLSLSYEAWINMLVYIVSGIYSELDKINGIQFTFKKNIFPNVTEQFVFIKIWNNDCNNKPVLPIDMFSTIEKEFSEHNYNAFAKKEIFNKN